MDIALQPKFRRLRLTLILALCFLTALTIPAPASGQELFIYTDEAAYNADIPAGSLSTTENFDSISVDANVSQTTAETWDGFTLLASGQSLAFGPSRYCVSLASSSCVGYNRNAPAVKGVAAGFGASNSGAGQLTFDFINEAFAFGINNIDWNDRTQRSEMRITLSNGAIVLYNRPAQSRDPPAEFIGFKLDDSSIAAGVHIESLDWYGVGDEELVGIFGVRTSSAPPNPLIVTSTADTDTIGTLRNAINYANTNAGADVITFDIAGTGPHTIALVSDLPSITNDGLTINGLSQTGAACGQLSAGVPHDLQIFINGGGSVGSAFNVFASDVEIKGLAVGNFQGKGFYFESLSNALVECNYFGTLPDGVTSSPLVQGSLSGSTQFFNVTKSAIRNNLISGNNDDSGDLGLIISNGSSDILITGNIFGLNETGTAALPNGGDGVMLLNSNNVTIGGLTSADRNVISGNLDDGLEVASGSSNVTVLGNYIGVGSDGTASVPNGSDGLAVLGATNVTIGGTAPGAGNVISSNGDEGIDISQSGGFVSILGNRIGTDIGGTLNRGNNDVGIRIDGNGAHFIGDGTQAGGNIIAHSNNDGIRITGSGFTTAILANSIYANGTGNSGGIGIDLNDDGVSSNDPNDTDSGANDLLNFPVLNAVLAYDSTNLGYNFDLDVPANTEGYRIDFYLTGVVDGSGFGQGQTWLGSVDVDHAGGDLNFSGVLTANTVVTTGQSISATATRKTATSYDITSEFASNAASTQAQYLTVAITQETYDIIGRGAFDLPGNDQLVSVKVTNSTGLATTQDSIELVVGVPANSAFYFGDIDDAGPETDPVIFEGANASGVTFTYPADVRFSDSLTKPAYSECAYTPEAGYDPAVRFICINPKGILPAGDPNPSFDIQFRQSIP